MTTLSAGHMHDAVPHTSATRQAPAARQPAAGKGRCYMARGARLGLDNFRASVLDALCEGLCLVSADVHPGRCLQGAQRHDERETRVIWRAERPMGFTVQRHRILLTGQLCATGTAEGSTYCGSFCRRFGLVWVPMAKHSAVFLVNLVCCVSGQ